MRRFIQSASDRFIPACAGNGSSGTISEYGTPVHPRVCGERAIPVSTKAYSYGSSPRVRGTAAHGLAVFRGPAGSSPRVRGTGLQPRSKAGNGGSSPRVRGTAPARPLVARVTTVHPRVCGERLDVAAVLADDVRFIPACAGNGPAERTACRRNPVHPRVCGERTPRRARSAHPRRFIPACAGNGRPAIPSTFAGGGSSPRVRGTGRRIPSGASERFIPACAGNGVCIRFGALRRRFIPACAGNGGDQPAVRQPTVHPRVCGERRFSCIEGQGVPGYGSSPRVRGTARAPVAVRPASSGSSPRVRGTARGQCRRCHLGEAVHPRVCGERPCSDAHLGDLRVRFIPACAGNGQQP